MVEDLDRLQVAVGELFPVPRDLTLEDYRELRRAIRLLDGDCVKVGTGPITLDVTDPQPFIDEFERAPMSKLAIGSAGPYDVHIAGHDINLGPYTVFVPDAQLDRSSITPAVNGGGHQLKIFPGPDSAIEIALREWPPEECVPDAEPDLVAQ